VAADEELDRIEVFDVLARLVDKSLVQHAGDRYRMLETLRQYGLERADDARELPVVRDRHLAWLRPRAASWATDREVLTEPVLAEIAAETPDLIAALDWSLGPGRDPAIDLLEPLGNSWRARLAYAEARSVSSRVLASFEEGSRDWLEALSRVVFGLVSAGEIGGIPVWRRALERHGDSIPPLARARVEGAVAWVTCFLGDLSGLQGLERAIEGARAAGARPAEVQLTLVFAMLMNHHDLRRARPLLAWVDRHLPPNAAMRSSYRQVAGAGALRGGDFARARSVLGAGSDASFELGSLALLTADRAPLRESFGILDQVGEAGLFEGNRALLWGVRAILDGNFEAAREHLLAGSRAPGGIGLYARQTLASVFLRLGRHDEAASLLEELERGMARGFNAWIASCDKLRAYVLRKADAFAAESAAHAALARSAEFGFPLDQVEALEALALIAGDTGRLEEAGRLLGAASAFRSRTGFSLCYFRSELDELEAKLDPAVVEGGSRLSLEEAVEYARRGRGERARPAHGWESLTPTEARVVELVSAGLPNKEIAQKLFVSLATVKTHLVHVYGKLDVRTRAELAAEAARRAVRTME
jgi:DNA-binding CsgD family transcriptional regulator